MAQRTKGTSTSATGASATSGADVVADAYIFGYPIVLMDVTRRLSTAVPSPTATRAPINQFAHLRAFPDASFKDVVSPNADTLYSVACLDLGPEPILLSVPDMENRYYLMPMLDAWTNVFASPGTRTTGNAKHDFAIVGPRWSGTRPQGLTPLTSPTNFVWIIGRTQTNGKKDFDAVHEIQDQYQLRPLSAWGKPYRAPACVEVDRSIDVRTPPPEQVARMDAGTFFGRLNALMVDNPPNGADAPALSRFARFGIGPGRALDPQALEPAMDAGLVLGRERLTEEANEPAGTIHDGWDTMPENTARFGTDYRWRAVVALTGLGANLREDAVYPRALVDASGQPFSGAHEYTLRFPKGALPPVKAFWSLTMYDAAHSFVDNPIGRYALGDRDRLVFASDESLTFYIQHDPPGREREPNWLPAPPDAFSLFLRLYWPTQAVLDGRWHPPAVELVR